jgi:hypothetical protein
MSDHEDIDSYWIDVRPTRLPAELDTPGFWVSLINDKGIEVTSRVRIMKLNSSIIFPMTTEPATFSQVAIWRSEMGGTPRIVDTRSTFKVLFPGDTLNLTIALT